MTKYTLISNGKVWYSSVLQWQQQHINIQLYIKLRPLETTPVINPFMPEVDIFEFMHEIHVCGLQRYSMNKNLKLKKKSVPITEHET